MKIIIKETSQGLFTGLFLSSWYWAFAIHAKYFFVCQTCEIIFYGIWCSYQLDWGTVIQGFWLVGQ